MLFSELPKGADPGYVALATDQRWVHLKNQLEGMWARWKPYAEPGFLVDLPRDFSQRVWELYLGDNLLRAEHALLPAASRGPDFLLQQQGVRLALEATVAFPGTGSDRVPDPPTLEEGMARVPIEAIALRVTNAISQKIGFQYPKWIQGGVIDPESPIILAISVGEMLSAPVNSHTPLSARCCLAIDTVLQEVGGQRATQPSLPLQAINTEEVR